MLMSVSPTASFKNQSWQEVMENIKSFAKIKKTQLPLSFSDWACQCGTKGKSDDESLYKLLVLIT